MRTEIVPFTSSGESNENTCHTLTESRSPRSQIPNIRLRRLSRTLFIIVAIMAALRLSPVCTALADNYSDLAAHGYRWVTVDGPYACASEPDVQRIVGHDTDEAELQVVESIRCYYLIPGTIVHVIKEDPAHNMSEVQLVSINSSLWTYSRFLSKHPVHDTYGIIETPANSGLIQATETTSAPVFLYLRTAQTRKHKNP
jgi:hypothetical protein